MFENLIVIGRMNERLQLLRAEVEGRGMRWADAEVEDKAMTDVDGEVVNGTSSGTDAHTGASQQNQAAAAPSGRLTDDELRARLLERLGDDGGEEEGVHL